MYETLEAAGYTRDKNIRVAGYDARLTPDMADFSVGRGVDRAELSRQRQAAGSSRRPFQRTDLRRVPADQHEPCVEAQVHSRLHLDRRQPAWSRRDLVPPLYRAERGRLQPAGDDRECPNECPSISLGALDVPERRGSADLRDQRDGACRCLERAELLDGRLPVDPGRCRRGLGPSRSPIGMSAS